MGSAVETAMTVRYRGKGLSVARGLFLVFGYGITSSILGLAVAVTRSMPCILVSPNGGDLR
jgi:hypothetical protein